MFKSFRFQIILFVILIITGTTGTTLFLINKKIESVFFSTIQKETIKLNNSVIKYVEIEYNSIIFHKKTELTRRKQELKDIINAALVSTQYLYEQAQQGKIPLEQAKRQAKDIIRNIRFNNGVGYIWVNNKETPVPRILVHPMFPKLEGKNPDIPKFYCIPGNKKHLLLIFNDLCDKNGEGYVEYFWPKLLKKGLSEDRKKISFVKEFKPWHWVLGTGLYIDDIDAEAKRRLVIVKEELKKILKKISISKTGYTFIFNGESKLIIHPIIRKKLLDSIKNPSTGHSIFKDLTNSITENNSWLHYKWDKPLDPKNYSYKKSAYTSYFKPLDWYISTTFYEDDILQPYYALERSIIIIAIIFVIVALIISILLSKNLVTPLQKLVATAQVIEKEGMHSVKVPISGTTETKELGQVFQAMLTSLNEREQQLQGISKNLPGVIYQLKKEDNGDFHFTFITKKMGELLGIKNNTKEFFNEFISRIKEDRQESFLSTLSDSFEKNKQWFFEEEFILQDNKIIWIQGRGTLTTKHNEALISGIFLDITEQKKMASQLQQTQKMDSIGQLAGGIAHDFNNMLGGILGYSELIKLKLTDEKLKKYINGIISATNSAASLTEKLLTYSRQAENLLTTVSVHKSISTALDILERTIDKKVSLSKDLKAAPDIIIGDPAQLENLFLNLGLNARDAMEQGEFSIKTESVILSKSECISLPFTLTPGEYIKISISDTGSGIPVDIQEKIFEPFFTTKEVGKGTGLGLAAVYGAVKEHKGAILLDSIIDTGTTFTIYLPIAKEQSKTMEESNNFKPNEINKENKTSILVVDDEDIIQDTLKSFLEEWNYSVTTACNGKEAIEIYKKNPTDLIILDIIMPEMGGEECFYKLKEIDPNVKVVLSSGFTKNASINKLLENGVLDFIKKPFHYESLQKILEKYIR